MATFLDITLISGARVIFTWLLVYLIVWGLLAWTKPFGESSGSGPYALVALVAAFLVVMSPTMRLIVEFMTPWFVMLIIFIFFILFILRMFALGDSDMSAIISNGTVHGTLIVIIMIIVLFALGEAFGQQSLQATQPDAQPMPNTMPVIGPDGQPQGTPQASQGSSPQPGQPGSTSTASYSVNFINTLFHPKILAVIAMILIGTVTVWLLGRPQFA